MPWPGRTSPAAAWSSSGAAWPCPPGRRGLRGPRPGHGLVPRGAGLPAPQRPARPELPVETLLVDWREPPARLLAGAPYDLVAAADVLYEARNASALERLLPRLAGPAGRVLIADPRRPDARLLLEPLAAAGWSHRREDVTVRGRVDEAGPVVHLHHLRPPDAGA